ncbi:SsrA-binding protein SmpB [Spirochaetia bacterium 38H-sp]|uniref:SsrA-binding protein n=1 Tax=Rarispira pelagica TaxID=3141764 RepID=A0ABU9UAU6_9SPIR
MSKDYYKKLGENKKARFNYHIEDSLECGMELKGSEVKSLKSGKFSFGDAYVRITNNQLWLIGLHITPYSFGTIENHEPTRKRKLLAHSREINQLRRKTEERGYTLVPLSIYIKNGLIKIQIGLAKGKKRHDKRAVIKDRDIKRDLARELKK